MLKPSFLQMCYNHYNLHGGIVLRSELPTIHGFSHEPTLSHHCSLVFLEIHAPPTCKYCQGSYKGNLHLGLTSGGGQQSGFETRAHTVSRVNQEPRAGCVRVRSWESVQTLLTLSELQPEHLSQTILVMQDQGCGYLRSTHCLSLECCNWSLLFVVELSSCLCMNTCNNMAVEHEGSAICWADYTRKDLSTSAQFHAKDYVITARPHSSDSIVMLLKNRHK